MHFNHKLEKTSKAWVWRVLLGPAILIDGLIATITLGTINIGAALEVSRRLTMERIDSMKANGQT